MSLWILQRDTNGRLDFYQVGFPFLIVVTIFGLGFTALLPFVATAPLKTLVASGSTLFLGFSLFLLAKASVYRTGRWFSFGSGRMSGRMKRCYRLGYLLMVPAALMTFLLCLLILRIQDVVTF